MNYFNIDAMAIAGYEYATGTGCNRCAEINTEMELLAFNSGITNANTRHNLTVDKIIYYGSVHVEGKLRTGDKELQTVWGQN